LKNVDIRVLSKEPPNSEKKAGHTFVIFNYYDYPISTGPLEGRNNKIKTIQKQTYGYRDMDFFKLKIY